jgi:ABC-2 type transport system permease protein
MIRRLLRGIGQTLTIARRDFTATVFTPTFLLFLLTPVLMIGLGMVGGQAGQSIADSGEARLRIVAIAPAAQAGEIRAVDRQLRLLFRREDAPPSLLIEEAGRDPAGQARAQFDRRDVEITAVLFGPLEAPVILRSTAAVGSTAYLKQLAEQVVRARRAGGTGQLSNPTETVVDREGASGRGKGFVAFLGVAGIFLLTLMLSGQVVGTMAEERSNKVIEILAAAVPLESVFLGKIIGMFGASILFLIFWGTLILGLPALLPSNYVGALLDIGPAVGQPAYPLLFVAYFTMAYLLMGAVFLSAGALTSNQRELQMLSLPITIFQVAMFGWSAFAISNPESWVAVGAMVFPFSSPSAMVGYAATSPELWPHFVALGWQALWVAVVITIGSRLFRRGVLKSGSPRRRRRNVAAAAVAIAD